jgi:tRNA pseudouridine38-40 synthase
MSMRCSITTCLKSPPGGPSFNKMSSRTYQLVVQYDGYAFRGWQRQPEGRTVQAEIESAVARLLNAPVHPIIAAGRTDAGVHATGQAVRVVVPERWTPEELRRALNAVLPHDISVSVAHEMVEAFNPRFDALSRRYRYVIGCNGFGRSPFRNRFEWDLGPEPDVALLRSEASALPGEHAFWAFARKGTAPKGDDHRCIVKSAEWLPREGGVQFVIEANRFLHHMVRFLVGTMVEVATGRRAPGAIESLLQVSHNTDVSPPAPPHGLYLEHVVYPDHRYRSAAREAAA